MDQNSARTVCLFLELFFKIEESIIYTRITGSFRRKFSTHNNIDFTYVYIFIYRVRKQNSEYSRIIINDSIIKQD